MYTGQLSAGRFRDVSCTALNFCVAVGDYTVGVGGVPHTFVGQLHGSTTWGPGGGGPNVGTSTFSGVSCVTATDCVAIGSVTDTSDSTRTLTELWDGTSFTLPSGLSPANGHAGALAGVSCDSVSSCMSVGTSGNATLVLRGGIATTPGPPTGVSGIRGNASVAVTFAPPTSDGGAPITGYTASCSSTNGGASGSNTGQGTPIAVAGLTNGATYSCTVAAMNANGTGPTSVTNTVVPDNESLIASYTGDVQTYTVPAGVNPVTIETWGAEGGTCDASGSGVSPGGLGGHVRATVAVTPGEVLEVRVGGAAGPVSGGFNGGGDGGTIVNDCGAGGGGATDVRQGGDGLANRIVVAGGGGGNNHYDSDSGTASSPGGAGGGLQGGGSGVEGVGADALHGGGGGGWFGGQGAQGWNGADGAFGWSGGEGGSGHATPSGTSVINDAGIRYGDGFVTITPAVPTPPRALAVAAGNAQATLQWQAPASGVVGLNSYEVTPYKAGVAQTPQTFPPTTTTATITGLTNGTAYTFTVAALNSVGASATATTQPLVVGAPAPLRSLNVAPGSTTATLSWVAPLQNNGAPISHYVVQVYVGYFVQSQWQFAGTASRGTITGLTNGKRYGFHVAAENSRGLGQQSIVAVIVGTPTAPGKPVVVPSSGQAKLSWTRPASNNGAAITGYTVVPYIAGVAQPARVLNSTATTATITGLTNGTSYAFRVAARNARGTGPVSLASAAAMVGTPTEPTSVVASVGNQQATVTWTAPPDDGGSAITGYVVTPYIAGVAQMPRTYNSPATSEVVSSLQNGKTYTFTVAAKNARGTGPKSAPSSPITLGTPTAPRNPSAIPGNGSATVHWNPPTTGNGGGITGYVITPYLSGVAQPVRIYNSAATTQVVTGLTNAKAYTFKIAAKNGNGTGPLSAATAPPIIVGAPTAPTGVSATAGHGSASVHWSAPSNNGAAISGYVVTPYRNGIAQAAWNFTGTITTRTVTGLTAGQSYTFKVAAKNSRGTGPQSVPSNAVTPT